MKNEDREESNAFASLIHKPLQSPYCHAFFEPRGATDNPLAWLKACSGGEKTVHLEGGGVGDVDLKPGKRPPGQQFQWCPAPRSAVQPRRPLVTTSLVLRPSINGRRQDRVLLTTLLWPWRRSVPFGF